MKRAREIQANRVMPLIGPLLDQWEQVPNSSKDMMREDCPLLCAYLDRINKEMEH
jgi:hypothetical protein